ncbi:MAG: fructose-6-phosphate aldolase [Bacteroidia bacterium]|nr:fructose-6-phosphate aldolase [Bacteroidia bacterium]
MYILKTKGTAKIPDYVQIRDENFILSSHFTLGDMENTLSRNGLIHYKDRLIKIINELPYGELKQFDF